MSGKPARAVNPKKAIGAQQAKLVKTFFEGRRKKKNKGNNLKHQHC